MSNKTDDIYKKVSPNYDSFNDSLNAAIGQVNSTISAHIANSKNPHGTTATDVQLGNVDNYKTASEAEAREGNAKNLFMTPYLVDIYVQENAVTSDNVESIVDDITEAFDTANNDLKGIINEG